LENLFDSVDDPRTEDETFLPLKSKQTTEHREKCKKQNPQSGHRLWECLYLDWSKEKITSKMKNLSEVLFKSPGSKGPDVLIVEEVENKAIVEEWNQKHLKKANYSVYHVDSPDKRGIDQAVLTRLPVLETKYHRLEFKRFFKKFFETLINLIKGVTIYLLNCTINLIFWNPFFFKRFVIALVCHDYFFNFVQGTTKSILFKNKVLVVAKGGW
jgi:hypothetical protein